MKDIPSANVHSIESFSCVDGPGLRSVIFLQGCNLRCRMCANPDTWNFKGGNIMTSQEICKKVLGMKDYFDTIGGITISGGEPLNSPMFVKDVFSKLHQEQLTTCLDTSGHAHKYNVNMVLPYTDHVLFCIKHPDHKKYFELTGQRQTLALDFWSRLE